MNKFFHKPQNILFCLFLLISGCGGTNGNIHEAAVTADLAKLKRIVARGVSVNQQDEKKLTALHIAAYHGQKDHIRLRSGCLKTEPTFLLKDYKAIRLQTWLKTAVIKILQKSLSERLYQEKALSLTKVPIN